MIKADFHMEDINKNFQNVNDELHLEIIYYLQYVGELCINEARINGSYTDQTGNLRNSIGYMISYNGDIVNNTGIINPYDYDISPKGYQITVVAGMNYAFFVENGHVSKSGYYVSGRNVLTGAEILAQYLLNQLFGLK
ncbi:MAG: hypothetical protein LBV69_00040 [Bacteroidales bacterium]|jgi:hypothetical protein|nr:hypothetical protein [Bacteroidales bacterium]